jgi:ubiquitin C-terminal hydrolase
MGEPVADPPVAGSITPVDSSDSQTDGVSGPVPTPDALTDQSNPPSTDSSPPPDEPIPTTNDPDCSAPSRLDFFKSFHSQNPVDESCPAFPVTSRWLQAFAESPDTFELPIDNAALVKDGRFDPDAADYVLVSGSTWDLLFSWFGGGPALPILVTMPDGRPRPSVGIRIRVAGRDYPFDAFLGETLWEIKLRFAIATSRQYFRYFFYISDEEQDEDDPPVGTNFILRRPRVTPPGHCGIRNVGNTCYLGSAVQCLAHLSLFAQYFRGGKFGEDINRKSRLGTQGRVAAAFGALVEQIWSGEDTLVDPLDLKDALADLVPRFVGSSTQDSHEFLLALLNTLHEDLATDAASFISTVVTGSNEQVIVCPECGTSYQSAPSFVTLCVPLIPPCIKMPLIFVPWDVTGDPAVIMFDFEQHLRPRDIELRLRRHLAVEHLCFATQTVGSTYRMALPSLAPTDTNYVFELPNNDCNFCILSLTAPIGTQICEFTNPILLDLPAREVSHALLVELCQRRLDPFWAEATDSPTAKLLRPGAFVFRDGERFRVRQVASWDTSELYGKFVAAPIQITLNPGCMRSFNWALARRLSVSREKPQALTLPMSLEMLEATHTLGDANLYFCRTCRGYVRGESRTTITRAPPVLILQLNRFSHVGGVKAKNSAKLDFEERLDITRFVHAGSGPHQYELAGVVHHIGSIDSGHYIAFCRIGGKWMKFNDSSFGQSSFREAGGNDAYILFYEKVQ